MAPRYVVGIDLGTTNCALAWLDASEPAESARVHLQDIPQLVSPGEVAARTLLPSFLYVPGELDFPEGGTALPWADSPPFVVGELARRRGAENPVRLVASAKSWLSYGGASRTAPILPWGAPAEVAHVSALDASAEYLRHLAAAFNAGVAEGNDALSLGRQDVLLTVPASFDEEARELTLARRKRPGSNASRCSKNRRRHSMPGWTRLATSGGAGSRSAIWCWSAMSAAARRTSA